MVSTFLVGLWLGVCSWQVATAQGAHANPSSKSVQSFGWDDRRLNLPRLLHDLNSKESTTVRGALDELAGGADFAKPAIPAVRGLVRHKDPLVRIDAAWTLIDLDDAADSNLTTILEDAVASAADTRAHAAKVLGRIVNPPFEIRCWGPPSHPWTPRPNWKKRVEPMLRAMLNDREAKVRVAAAEALVRIKSESNVAPVLLEALNMVARDDQFEAYHLEAYYLLERVDKDAAKKWNSERRKKAN